MFCKILKIVIGAILICLLYLYRKKILNIKNSLCGKYRWKRREFLVKYNYYKKKNFMIISFFKKILFNLSIIIIFVLVLLLFFYSIDILKFENRQIKNCFTDIDIKEKHYEFLWSQISSTLIVSTIIGFLGIFSTSYIYGKKQINVIFSEKGIFSLSKMFIYLMILIFVTLSVCINKGNSLIILLSFIVSLLLICYMLFKILIFYSFPTYYKNNIKYEYLSRERKHIKKAVPLRAYEDNEIENFKYRTMELIQINDNEYNKNIKVFMELIDISLLTNSKKVQEYYTEMIHRTDFISSILEIVEHFINYNKILEAANILNELFCKLKYYRIVLVQEYLSNNIIRLLILKGKDIDTELLAEKYFDILWRIINKYTYLLYLYYCELDFSYCRLGKKDKYGNSDIYYITNNNYLEDMYLSIRENTHLTIIEKERLFEDIYNKTRMMELEEKHPNCDVRSANRYMLINKNTISIPLVIKGEPIVLMLLKMFEEHDIQNIILFSSINVSKELRAYIVTLTSLALIEFISKDCVREYVNDLIIKEEDIIDIYTKSKFKSYIECSNDLYKIFKENYIEDYQRVGRYYMLMPRLTLSMETINNFYYYIYVEKIKKESDFYKITELTEFIPDEKILNIFRKLEI